MSILELLFDLDPEFEKKFDNLVDEYIKLLVKDLTNVICTTKHEKK